MLSTRVVGLACAVAVFVCLMAAPVSARPEFTQTASQLPLQAMLSTTMLLSAATLHYWRTRGR
jgi:hypothetical protein